MGYPGINDGKYGRGPDKGVEAEVLEHDPTGLGSIQGIINMSCSK